VINRDAHVAKCADEAKYRSDNSEKKTPLPARRAVIAPSVLAGEAN
jgi:hypothetical protein